MEHFKLFIDIIYVLVFMFPGIVVAAFYGSMALKELITNPRVNLKYDIPIWILAILSLAFSMSEQSGTPVASVLLAAIIMLMGAFGYTAYIAKTAFKQNLHQAELRTVWQCYSLFLIAEMLIVPMIRSNIESHTLQIIEMATLVILPLFVVSMYRKLSHRTY